MYKNRKLVWSGIVLLCIAIFGCFYWYTHRQTFIRNEFIVSVPVALKSVFGPIIADYQKDNPNVRVTMKEANSEQVYSLLEEDALDVAITYFPISEPYADLKSEFIGNMPYIFILDRECGITNLTTEQVHDIFAGKVKNWQQLGGNNLPVIVVQTNSMNAMPRYIKEQFLHNDKFTACSLFAERSVDALPKIDKIGGAIGYATVVYFLDEQEKEWRNGLVVASINGVFPDMESVENKSYVANMPISAVYKKRISGKNMKMLLELTEKKWQEKLEKALQTLNSQRTIKR